MFHHTGIGVYIRQILPKLFELRPDWHYQLIVARDFAPDFALPRHCEVITAHSNIYTLGEQFEMPRLVGRSCDFLWVPHYNIPLYADVPLLVTVHDVAHLTLAEFRRIPQKQLYARTLFRAVRDRARHVFFVSQFTQREFERVLGAPRGEVSLSRNSIDPGWFQATQPAPKGDYIAFVGNFKPHKNLHSLLKACEKLRADRPLRLTVVAHRSALKRAPADLAACLEANRDWVQITDALSDGALRQVVANAQMLVYPSTYEGFGLPPLEAMAVSCPTVVSDIEATREACGEASLFVDPEDSAAIAEGIRRVQDDAQLRQQLIHEGHLQVRKYDALDTARGIVAAMEAVIHAPAAKERRVA